MRFARLFEMEGGEQMLVTVDYDNERERYSLTYRTDCEGVSYRMALGFSPDKVEDHVLAMLDELKPEDVAVVWRSLIGK